MHDSGFTARRILRTYRQTINAPPESVFPLICPVREADWLDGWQHAMIYSKSGLIEEGAVFSTPHAGEGDTVWIVTRYDPKEREIEFARFTPNSRTCVLTIAVRPGATLRSYVDIAYTYTATTPAGNDFIDRLTEETFLAAVVFWEKSMNHFLATGKKLVKT
jgi:hypothetical protein